MIINYIRGNEVHTVLFMQIDLAVSSVIIAVGLCLSLITLKLYTIMQCWSLRLQQVQNAQNPNNIAQEVSSAQRSTEKRFNVAKYIILCAMGVIILFTITQLILVYGMSDFASISPAKVSALEFITTQ